MVEDRFRLAILGKLKELSIKTMNEIAANILPNFAIPSRKPSVKQITLELTPDEVSKLEKHCYWTGKEAADIIRELIQELPIT
ncbi:MAG: CopG family transcriptional regulator [Nostochopsis sp.]